MTDVYTAGKFKPAVQGDKVADTEDLDGAYVKSINAAGTAITQQDADGNPQVVEVSSGSGGLTAAQRHDLQATPGLIAKTSDLEVTASARGWADVADLAQGGFVSNNAALGPEHAAALAYVVSSTPTPAEAGHDYVYIRIPAERSSRDYRIRQDGSLGEFFIRAWDHVGVHEDSDYFRSRHNLFSGYDVTIQYDAVTAIQTDFRGGTLAEKAVVDSDDFGGNLAPADDTVQKVAQKLDDLTVVSHALDNDEIDDGESDVQGTISGEGLARGVAAHSPFTDVEQDILDDLAHITFPHPTDDWQVRQTYAVRDFFNDRAETFLSLGWDSGNRLRALSGAGRVARLGRHDQGRIYDGEERLRGGLISGDHWLYLVDHGNGGSAIVRAPVDGGDSDPEFEIVLRYFSIFADPDSGTLIGLLRRISHTEIEVGLLAYDAAAGTITAEDTITLDRAHISDALGDDYAPLTDVHRESATGVYQDVAGAVLEGDTLYLLLTDIRKADGHTTSALVGWTLAGTPNNRTLTLLAADAVDELPVSDELTSALLPLEADELFLARDLAAYRLSPQAAAAPAPPATLAGQTVETLFDNRADTEAAITVNAGTGSALLSADIALTRALAEADDDHDLRSRFLYTQDGQRRSIDVTMNAGVFRSFDANNVGVGTVAPTEGYHIFATVDGRPSRNLNSLFGRAALLVRGSVAAGDVVRMYLNTTSNSAVAITEMRGVVELVPRIDALTVSGSGAAESQQQQLSGATLTRSTIVSGGTLLAANAFDFDLTAAGIIAVGNYVINPIPIADIFDFVATIRVGGRAGNLIRLSKEQFDYVGETSEAVAGTWPFGGTGGGSWGNVSELPCAFLFVDHVTDGIVKPSVRPQRQQVGWTISGTETATAVLIFFNYDAADANLTGVRLVSFTDQVVEIEGIHIHYWQGA